MIFFSCILYVCAKKVLQVFSYRSIRYPTKTLIPAASAAKAANMFLISLFYLILFSCILYAGTAKVLQHDEKKHGILPVDKIRGLVIIKVIEQLTFEAVGSLRYLISLKESRLAAALSGFFHICFKTDSASCGPDTAR